MFGKKLWLVSLILLTLSAPALTNQEKSVLLETAEKKYNSLSEQDKIDFFGFLFIKCAEYERLIEFLKKKIQEHEAQLK